MNNKKILTGFIALVALLAVAGPFFATFNDPSEPELKTPPLDLASESATHFLNTYMENDGRIARHDQNEDTTSSAQGYGLLISVALRDREKFDKILKWSETNLAQSDGVFASRWEAGKVVDQAENLSADLDIARALAIAGKEFSDASYTNKAKTLANSIQNGSFVKSGIAQQNASELSTRAFPLLKELTGDEFWNTLTSRGQERIDYLINGQRNNTRMLSDWSDGARMSATYRQEAQRGLIRLAESCDEGDRKRAMQIWNLISRSKDARFADQLNLDGSVKDKTPSAVATSASAAGAKAAKDDIQKYALLDRADLIAQEKPSFEASAWTALTRIMHTTPWLGECS